MSAKKASQRRVDADNSPEPRRTRARGNVWLRSVRWRSRRADAAAVAAASGPPAATGVAGAVAITGGVGGAAAGVVGTGEVRTGPAGSARMLAGVGAAAMTGVEDAGRAWGEAAGWSSSLASDAKSSGSAALGRARWIRRGSGK